MKDISTGSRNSHTDGLVVLTLDFIAGEVMAVLKLDNQLVGQTQWKQNSQQCWDQRMAFDLDRVRYFCS